MSDSTKLAVYGAVVLGVAALIVAPGVAFMVQPRGTVQDSQPSLSLAKLVQSDLGGSGETVEKVVVERTEAKWRTIKGVFTLAGGASPPPQISVTTSDNCGPQYDWALVVNQENNGIKNLVVYVLDGIGENDADAPNPVWVHPQYSVATNPEMAEKLFDQEKCVFLEHMFVARTSQTIVLKNSDKFPHNVNISPKDGSRKYDNVIPPGATDTYQPAKPERTPFAVKCAIHSWMKGYMLFRDNPYFAVTNDKGEFTIENVPAGADLEFRAFHESKRVNFSALEVNGKAEKWSKGKFDLNLEHDPGGAPYEMNVVVK